MNNYLIKSTIYFFIFLISTMYAVNVYFCILHTKVIKHNGTFRGSILFVAINNRNGHFTNFPLSLGYY